MEQELADIEHNVKFLGLTLLLNELKPDTTEVLATLLAAKMRCVMSTGDAILTATSVAKICGIIPADTQVFLGDVSGNLVT